MYTTPAPPRANIVQGRAGTVCANYAVYATCVLRRFNVKRTLLRETKVHRCGLNRRKKWWISGMTGPVEVMTTGKAAATMTVQRPYVLVSQSLSLSVSPSLRISVSPYLSVSFKHYINSLFFIINIFLKSQSIFQVRAR